MKRLLTAVSFALALTSPVRAGEYAETAGQLLATVSYVQQHCPQYGVNVVHVRSGTS